MELSLRGLRESLPGHLHDTLSWDFIPWAYVKERHGDEPGTQLIALLEAYHCLTDLIDARTLSSQVLPENPGRCLRCGSCCVYMRPGAVSGKTYRKWEDAGAPVAFFYSPVGRREPTSSYNCWFHNGVRLRMCPFLLQNRADGRPFCSIHHTGRSSRPRACSRFQPNPPICQTGSVLLVP